MKFSIASPDFVNAFQTHDTRNELHIPRRQQQRHVNTSTQIKTRSAGGGVPGKIVTHARIEDFDVYGLHYSAVANIGDRWSIEK